MHKVLMHISRIFLGIVFLGAGLNGYIVLLGYQPIAPVSDAAMSIFKFDYLLLVEKSIEVIAGLLLLFNQYTPLTIAILSPIVANILLLHIFVDPSLLPLAIMLTISLCYLLFFYRESFKCLLVRKPNGL